MPFSIRNKCYTLGAKKETDIIVVASISATMYVGQTEREERILMFSLGQTQREEEILKVQFGDLTL